MIVFDPKLFFFQQLFLGVASELNGAGGVNKASVLPRLPPIVPQIIVLLPGPPAPPSSGHQKLFTCIARILDLDVGPTVRIIQSHLYLQELPNDAKHHHFPISDLSVCFYQFVTNSVSSICCKL